MPTFSELQDHMQAAIRKGLEGSVFVKRFDAEDDEITALTDATGLLAIPAGYEDVGIITKEQGVTWTRDITTSDVTGLGYAEPVRRDITGDTSGMQFTMRESKRTVFELHDGLDLSAVTQDANGNVTWDKPDRPASIYYRVLALFKDGDGADAIYFAKWGPRMQVTDRGETAWNEENNAEYPVTLSAFVDDAFGTSLRSLWAGPTATITAMGFPTA